jgi:tetratricopeptide (TPR) repeat protein
VNNYIGANRKLTQYFGLDINKYESHQYRQRAKIEENSGNYDLAEKLYLEYLNERLTARNLKLLIDMYSKMGDSRGALQIIEDYEPSFPRSNLLKLEKGKILVRLGNNIPAVDILEDLYNTDPLDADCLLTLVRAFLNLSKEEKKYLEKAKILLNKSDNAKPRDLYVQAKILLMIEEEDFNNAVRLLFRKFPDEKYGNNDYINSLKATVYLKKGISYKEKGLPEYQNILTKALGFTDYGLSLSSVPILMQRIWILREMDETALIEETKEKILKINPKGKDIENQSKHFNQGHLMQPHSLYEILLGVLLRRQKLFEPGKHIQ